MSYICIDAAFIQIGQFFKKKNVIFEAFQVSNSLISTAHGNQYTQVLIII